MLPVTADDRAENYSAQIIAPILQALEEIHHTGLVHRDVSPDNIFVCKDKPTDPTFSEVKLLDFGAAREVFSEDEKSLSILVKRGYSPYEQYTKKNQGPWTDVYALCAVLYRCVTGAAPFSRFSPDICTHSR